MAIQRRKTKIVCSLGPATHDDDVMRNLIMAGMNVARLNMSHSNHESHSEFIEKVRRISSELGFAVAILLDTKGPEIRSGMVEDGGTVTFNEKDPVIVTTDDALTAPSVNGNPGRISITWKEAASRLQKGNRILVADGLLELDVIDIDGGNINCIARNKAAIGSRKNVNLIGIHANLPIMSEQDKLDIAFGVKMGVDFIAASFVSFPEEITEIKTYLASLNANTRVIAKIENAEGLENIKGIAELADGVMVARGDLGVQLPTEQIPLAQKHIINMCRRAGKPVITATQMLESMIVNPRPTRAELTDVANAILDGTDAVMLSGETAMGAYPIEAVKTIDRIARTIEDSGEYRSKMYNFHSECLADAHGSSENLGKIMSKSGVEVAIAVNARAIVTPTFGGNTARLLSVYRPDEPIIAVTPDQGAERVLQLYWGVKTLLRPQVEESETMIQNTMKAVYETGIASLSEKIVLVAGLPLQSPTMVNTVRVLILGTVLAQAGFGGHANPEIYRAGGRIIHALDPDDAAKKLRRNEGGDILVCRVLTDDYIPILRLVSGVISEGVSEISEQQLRYTNPRLVWLTNITNAQKKLESGLTVTIDAKNLLVYEGSL